MLKYQGNYRHKMLKYQVNYLINRILGAPIVELHNLV